VMAYSLYRGVRENAPETDEGPGREVSS